MTPNVSHSPHHAFHTYIAYLPGFVFIGFLVGFIAHFVYPIRAFPGNLAHIIGAFLLVGAPLLILWAQKGRRKFYRAQKKGSVRLEDLLQGPYVFSRHPTQLGLFLLVLGFSLLMNSLLMLVAVLFTFLFTHFIFIPKEEKMLAEHLGHLYHAYKERVRMWL